MSWFINDCVIFTNNVISEEKRKMRKEKEETTFGKFTFWKKIIFLESNQLSSPFM